MNNWADIPSLVLENIYSKLDLFDRYETSLVCKNWHFNYLNSNKLSSRLYLNIMYSPSLINLQNFLENYVQKFGLRIKYLKINVSSGDLTDLGKYLLNFSLVSLFKRLSSLNKQLVELEIINLKITNLPQFISGDIEMIHALKQYLKMQNSLNYFSIKDSDIPDEITFSIIETTLNICSKSIKIMKICRIFEKIDTYQSSKFVNLFLNLTNLREIETNYHYLSQEVLEALIESAKNLKIMKLYINSFKNKSETSNSNEDNTSFLTHYTKLTSQIWNNLYLKHPNVEVTFIYEDCGLEFINLFQVTINNDTRLKHLFIRWAYIRMNFFKTQFSQISSRFSHTLLTFEISLFIKTTHDIHCLFEFTDLAAKQIEIIVFKFDTDDLTLIEYSLQKFKKTIDRLKLETCSNYFKNLKKFHLFIDISSIGEHFLVEFRKLFKRICFNISPKFSLKEKFLLTFCNFSVKNEYSIEI